MHNYYQRKSKILAASDSLHYSSYLLFRIITKTLIETNKVMERKTQIKPADYSTN